MSESMQDYEKEIEESLKNRKAYEDPDAEKWTVFQGYMDNKEVLRVKVEDVVKAGCIAYIDGVRAFLPASQLSTSYVKDLETYRNKSLDVVVITVEQENKKLIISHREIEKVEKEKEYQQNYEALKVGDVVDGKVENIVEYGVFVDLGNNLSGLLHISQISNKRVDNPKSVFKLGDEVRTRVIKKEDGKISLSKKVLEEDIKEIRRDEPTFEYKEDKKATTSFGDLLKNIKLD